MACEQHLAQVGFDARSEFRPALFMSDPHAFDAFAGCDYVHMRCFNVGVVVSAECFLANGRDLF